MSDDIIGPKSWLQVTPDEFERMVVQFLRKLGHSLESFAVTHHEALSSPDGTFQLDATARFRALGADFTVVIECKHHRNPIKRELVQVLADKVAALRAQKGMLFTTAPFQRGAIAYAQSRNIALVSFSHGGPVYHTRSLHSAPAPRRAYDAHLISLTDSGLASFATADSEYASTILVGGSQSS